MFSYFGIQTKPEIVEEKVKGTVTFIVSLVQVQTEMNLN